MPYDKELIAHKLIRWEHYLNHYKLPAWKELPDIGLYMDQVIALLGQYLDFIPLEDSKDKPVTPTTINNYVRLKVMPAPVKKRYGRRHLAYVVMICTLKQSMTLTEIQRILPNDMDDVQARRAYNDFVSRVSATAQVFIGQVRAVASQELVEGNDPGCMNLVMHSAVSSVLYKLLTVKLTNLSAAPTAEG